MVSHEFRTPLTSSLMLLENLLGMATLPDAAKKVLWLIISQINMLLCLINASLGMQLLK